MACIFRKMPYVFLSINKLHFSYTRKDLFSGKLPDILSGNFDSFCIK